MIHLRPFSWLFLISLLTLFTTLLFTSCISRNSHDETEENSELIIFHAGSLSAPFKEIARQFEAGHPGVKVMLEASGSVDCARKISELNKPCDLMASSDYKVIEKFLIPGHAQWHIPFAANEMVIAFTEGSRRAGEIDSSNWTEHLADPAIRFGRSNPDSDPCGYRTLLVFQLAEKHYRMPGLASRLEVKDTRYIRPKEVDLIALLEVKEIDYIFIYRSVAMQHHLNFLELPIEINLKEKELSEAYYQAAVTISGKRPGDSVIIRGEPMVYSITLIDNAPHPEAAMAFLDFLLDDNKGMKVMESMGQKSVIPSKNKYLQYVPDKLKKYILNPH